MNPFELIPRETVEIVWLGQPLGVMRDGQFVVERFAPEQLHELLTRVLDGISPRQRQFSLVVRHVCEAWRVPVAAVLGRDKAQAVVEARYLCLYIISDLFVRVRSDHVTEFFGRDKSLLSHARKVVSDRCDTEPPFKQRFENLRAECRKLLFPETLNANQVP